MLDVLAGVDSSKDATASLELVIQTADTVLSTALTHAAAVDRVISSASTSTSTCLDGRTLQEEFYSSYVWKIQGRLVERACEAASGATPHVFPSVYARSWFVQLYTLIARASVGYWRNNGYNWMRWCTLLGLVRNIHAL